MIRVPTTALRPQDLALILLVVCVWGVNFAVIKTGLQDVPPLLLGTLRFACAAFPALLFFRPPKVGLRWYLAYGLTIAVGQFAFLFTALHVGMPTGLASLVLQSQAFFTLLLGAWWLQERWQGHQMAGLLLAGVGLVLIGSGHGSQMPLTGFVLTVLAAASWSCGNIVTRQISQLPAMAQTRQKLAFVVWSSLVPPLPFLGLSLWLEGPELIVHALTHLRPSALVATAYLGWGATLLGYGLWTYLLSRYDANRVSPFSMLVPVVGLATRRCVLDAGPAVQRPRRRSVARGS